MSRLTATADWLVHAPLTWLLLTVAAYQAGRVLNRRTGLAIAQPALVGIVAVGAVLLVLDVDYHLYRDATELIDFWLGPATVALAVPLHRQARLLRGYVVPLLAGLAVGVVVSVVTGVLLVRLAGGDGLLERSMAPKAATTPVSIPLADQVGGAVGLAAVLTILAGILGAVAGPWVLDRVRVRDRRARGLALGGVSHGIGTARALQEDEVEGAFSGLAMGVTALLTSLLLPLAALLLW